MKLTSNHSTPFRSQSRTVGSAVARLVFVAFACVSTGCFSGRSVSSLDAGARPTVAVFVLPVQAGHVRLLSGETGTTTSSGTVRTGMSPVHDRQAVANASNRVLNTLGKGGANRLMTPVKLKTTTAMSKADWAMLDVYLSDPGPLDEPWKVKGLAEFSSKLGVKEWVRVFPTVAISGGEASRGGIGAGVVAGYEWKGTITIVSERLELEPAHAVRRGTGTATFWGSSGLAGAGGAAGAIVFPYALGKGFENALDQATRKSLTALFRDEGAGDVHEPAVASMERAAAPATVRRGEEALH